MGLGVILKSSLGHFASKKAGVNSLMIISIFFLPAPPFSQVQSDATDKPVNGKGSANNIIHNNYIKRF
jgi:hypothetical protein